MIFVRRDASDEEIIAVVLKWVDVLAKEDYKAVYDALGYSFETGEPGPDLIRNEIKYYRSPEFFPGVDDFTVSDWRYAVPGNPNPKQAIIRYKPNSADLAGAITLDLPLNGKWSDLQADFVLLEKGTHPNEYVLRLEEIRSWKQHSREI